jgi:hypothetical protein
MEEQLTYPKALEQLRGAYEREKIQLTAHISTLDVLISQLQREIEQLKWEKIDTPEETIPEPYLYTHPIRDMPTYNRVERRDSNA